MSDEAPPAAGQRLGWDRLPMRAAAALEAWLGAPVTAAISQPSGFSPGIAARVTAANRRRCFVKAIGPLPNPDSPTFHRREADVVAALPTSAPVPRLLWSFDEDGWVVLAFEEIDGAHPEMPWRDDQLARVLATMHELAELLTPSPIAGRTAAEVVATDIRGWAQLAAAPPVTLDPWSLRHLDRLVTVEANAPRAAAGDTLIHFDLRADNLLLTDERVYVLDWPHAAVGASWIDLIGFAPSVAMQGGPSPEELLSRYGVAADPDAVTAIVATIAGFFTARALAPPPPGLPTLRQFQAAQGTIARAWLAERLGL